MGSNHQPKVSVIVPIYNVENYIERCVRSLMEQTLDDIEYIFVNDATPDNSMDVLNRVIEDYPQRSAMIKIFNHETNKGQSSARNLGIKNSSGKYIFFVDSDDEITKDAIKIFYDTSEKYLSDLTIADNCIYNHGITHVVVSKISKKCLCDSATILNDYVNGKWYNIPVNKLITRQLIIDNDLYFPEGLKFEDELWTFQLATLVNVMAIVHDVTYTYIVHDNSTMTNITGYTKWLNFIDILGLMSKWITDKDLQKFSFVQRFFCLKIIQTLSNIKPLKYKDYKRITKTATFNVLSLYKQDVFSFKEYIAYMFFDLPVAIGFVYYKTTSVFFKIKGILAK